MKLNEARNIVDFFHLVEKDKLAKEYNERLLKDSDAYQIQLLQILKEYTYDFSLQVTTNYHTLNYHNTAKFLFHLDEDDLEYFKNKYLLKLEEAKKVIQEKNEDAIKSEQLDSIKQKIKELNNESNKI